MDITRGLVALKDSAATAALVDISAAATNTLLLLPFLWFLPHKPFLWFLLLCTFMVASIISTAEEEKKRICCDQLWLLRLLPWIQELLKVQLYELKNEKRCDSM